MGLQVDGIYKRVGFFDVLDVFRYWWLTVKASIIGVIIGMIPGLGGEAAGFFTYGYAMRTSKNPETFGKGNIEGVIGPEAANNSKEGGALIPTVGFGVPGSSGMAILLGAFLIMGIAPGPKMLTENLHVTFSMAWTLAIANILGAAIAIFFANHLAKLTFIRGSMIVPLILAFATLGSFSTSNSLGDILVTLVFGLVGYEMKKFKYPKAPLVMGLVLGRLAEVNLHISVRLYGMAFLLRPITLVLLILLMLTVLQPLLKGIWAGRSERGAVA